MLIQKYLCSQCYCAHLNVSNILTAYDILASSSDFSNLVVLQLCMYSYLVGLYYDYGLVLHLRPNVVSVSREGAVETVPMHTHTVSP